MRYENTNTPLPAMKKKEPASGTIPYSKTDFTTAVYGIAVKTTYQQEVVGGSNMDIYFTDTPSTSGSSVTPRFNLKYNNGVVTDWSTTDKRLTTCPTMMIGGVEYYYRYFMSGSTNRAAYQRINPTGYQGTSYTYMENNVRFFTKPMA